MEVRKVSAFAAVSDEVLADAQGMAAAYERWLNATPEQREQWATEAEVRRAVERADATPVPLTLDALLGKLNFTAEYAEHLVQPYCTCSDGYDGWDYCQHARDLGLVP